MLRVRVISGIAIFLCFFIFMWFSGPAMAAFLLVVSIIGFLEFTKANGVRDKEAKMPNVMEWFGVAVTIAYYAVLVFSGDYMYLLLVLCLGFLGIMMIYVLKFPKFTAPMVTATFFGIVYVPVMVSFYYLTRIIESPNKVVTLAWMTVIIAWLGDTFAYFFGRKLGKHKLAPVLSPKKSVEGALGGIIGATICNGLFGCLYLYLNKLPLSEVWMFLLIGAVGNVFSQMGDLAASAFKRNHDIKDYGKIIPGHGGILDRFDSFIITAPMVYFLLYFIK